MEFSWENEWEFFGIFSYAMLKPASDVRIYEKMWLYIQFNIVKARFRCRRYFPFNRMDRTKEKEIKR